MANGQIRDQYFILHSSIRSEAIFKLIKIVNLHLTLNEDNKLK